MAIINPIGLNKSTGENSIFKVGDSTPVTTANVVRVNKNPAIGEYSSIVLALASITTNSSSNLFLIDVGPGVYTESQIVMKSYVSLKGQDRTSCIIQPSNISQEFILGADESSVSDITARGAIGIGGHLFHYTGSGDGASFIIDNCIFGDTDTIAHIEGNSSYETIVIIQSCSTVTNINMTDGFLIEAIGGKRCRLIASGLFLNAGHSIINPDDFFEVTGDGSKLFLSDTFIIGPFSIPAGNAVHLFDGADVTIVGTNVINMNRVVWVENSGADSTIIVTGVHADSNTNDIIIDQPTALGSIEGLFQSSNSSCASPFVSFLIADPSAGGVDFTGRISFGDDFANKTDVTDLILSGPTMGLYDGGELSDGGGFNVDYTAGFGYTSIGLINTRQEWNSGTIILSANVTKYVYVDNTGVIIANTTFPDTRENIILGRVNTNNSGVQFIDDSPIDAGHYGNLNDNLMRDAIGAIFEAGCVVTENATAFHLNCSNGTYYFSTSEFAPSANTNVGFISYYQNGSGGWIRNSTNVVDSTHYDDGTGTLHTLTATQFVRHSLYLVGEGSRQKYFLVYGQTPYLTLLLAESGNIPTPPDYFNGGVVLIASIIVQSGSINIVTTGSILNDVKPKIGFSAPSSTATTIHNNLSGRTVSDTHPASAITNTPSGTISSIDIQDAINELDIDVGTKQDTLISATNIKTINSSSILGSGDLIIATGIAWGDITGTLSSQIDLQSALNGKQPLDSDLTTIAGLTATTDNFIVSVASNWASRTPTQVRTTLGLIIGTNVQAWDADLDTWATITPASGIATFLASPTSANLASAVTDENGSGKLIFSAGILNIASGKTFTSSNTLTLQGTDNSTLDIGTGGTLGTAAYTSSSAYQPLDSDLTTIASLTATTDNFITSVASAWASRTPTQVKTTLLLNLVENTALSTWAGTTNITTLGTIATGIWHSGIIDSTYGGTGINNAGRNLTINTNSGTINFSGASKTLTIPLDASVSGTNTGDQTTISGNAGTATALATGRTIGITGDLSYISPSFDGTTNITATGTLATVNINTGSFGSATQITTFTVNGKGLITAAANVTVTPAVGSITGLGTGVITALGVNIGSAGAFITFNGALGTPSSGILTNCTFPTLNQNTTGSAAFLTIARTIGGVLFDGTGSIVPQTIQSVNEATDTTCFPLFISASGSQSLQPLNNTGFIYNSNTNSLSATTFIGSLTGTASGNLVSGGALGTPSSGTLTNCTFPTLNQDTTGYASSLKSASTIVDVASATAPSTGQVLTATDSTHATWQTPSPVDYRYLVATGGYT